MVSVPEGDGRAKAQVYQTLQPVDTLQVPGGYQGMKELIGAATHPARKNRDRINGFRTLTSIHGECRLTLALTTEIAVCYRRRSQLDSIAFQPMQFQDGQNRV